MTAIQIGYARCSTDKQDLTVQQEALATFAEFEGDLIRCVLAKVWPSPGKRETAGETTKAV